MANLIESSQWAEGIYQLEEDDPVMGGADGVDNRPHKELAARTKFLKGEVEKTQGNLGNHNINLSAHAELLKLFAKLASPALSGVPTAPTAAAATNNTQIATTAFVKAAATAANIGAYTKAEVDGKVTTLNTAIAAKEPAFAKNTAFNKNFGTATGTVCQGNDARLSNARPASGGNADTVDGKHANDAAGQIALKTADNDINCRLLKQTYADQATINGGLVFRANATTDNFLRVCNNTAAIRTFLGLGNINNTADSAKPISTAVQTALNAKENAFAKNNAFNKNFGTAAGTVCQGNDARLSNARPPTSHAHDDRYYTESEMNAKLNTKANLASPALTGTPTAPTAAAATNNTQIATTAFVKAVATAASTGGIVGDSLMPNGWVKFANGLILQWGSMNSSTDGIASVLTASKISIKVYLRWHRNESKISCYVKHKRKRRNKTNTA